METSLYRLLAAAPDAAPALTAPGRPALSHEALRRLRPARRYRMDLARHAS